MPPTHKDMEHVASILMDATKRVVVLAGAGTSTSAGIPDFRSPGTGLYDNLAAYDLPYPEAVFDLDYFEERPQPFYTLARDLWPGVNYPPTLTHSFYALLNTKGRLISVLTQNIDGLERAAGVPDEKLVEAHGSFATASCIDCRHSHNAERVKDHVLRGTVARCENASCARLKATGEPGLVKPDIVFFGEGLPSRFFDHMEDVSQADLVLVLGTSLVVDPFGSLVYHTKKSATSVLINRDLYPAGSKFRFRSAGKGSDVALLGSCDDVVRSLTQILGWEAELDKIHNANLDRHNARSSAAKATTSAAKASENAAEDVGAVTGLKREADDSSTDGLAEVLAELKIEPVQREEGLTQPKDCPAQPGHDGPQFESPARAEEDPIQSNRELSEPGHALQGIPSAHKDTTSTAITHECHKDPSQHGDDRSEGSKERLDVSAAVPNV